MVNFICLALIGMVAGILSGLFGIGGGIIIIPALLFIMNFSQLKAQGTSLAVLLPPVGLLAFLEYYKKGNVDIFAGIVICAFLFIGAKFGAQIASHLPVDLLRKFFAVFIIIIGFRMLLIK